MKRATLHRIAETLWHPADAGLALVDGVVFDARGRAVPVLFVELNTETTTGAVWIGTCALCGSAVRHTGLPGADGWIGHRVPHCANELCPARATGYVLRVAPREWKRLRAHLPETRGVRSIPRVRLRRW